MSDLLSPSDQPISAHELAEGFRARERGSGPRLVGIELEACAVGRDDLEPVTVAGIDALLARLVARGWSRIEEPSGASRRTIGLARSTGERIALEPGGQIELVGTASRSLADVVTSGRARLAEMVEAADEAGLLLLGGGIQPFAPLDRIPWFPKRRYEILRRHFARAEGTLGPSMMKKTQSIQVSLDWTDEEDGARLLRAAFATTPILAALFAASPVEEGRPTGALSRRLVLWSGVDPERSGIAECAFSPSSGYDGWIDWVLDRRAIFRVREGHYEEAPPLTLRQVLDHGWPDGGPLTRADWLTHLTTMFTHARWKQVVEVRVLDGPLPGEEFAAVAFAVGLLDEKGPRDEALAQLASLSIGDLERGLAEAARAGLAGRLCGWRLGEWGRELLGLARAGLEERVASGREPSWVPRLLDPVEETIATGSTPAERLLRSFEASGRRPRALARSLAYAAEGERRRAAA